MCDEVEVLRNISHIPAAMHIPHHLTVQDAIEVPFGASLPFDNSFVTPAMSNSSAPGVIGMSCITAGSLFRSEISSASFCFTIDVRKPPIPLQNMAVVKKTQLLLYTTSHDRHRRSKEGIGFSTCWSSALADAPSTGCADGRNLAFSCSGEVGVPSNSTGTVSMAALSTLNSGLLGWTGEIGVSSMIGRRGFLGGEQYSDRRERN